MPPLYSRRPGRTIYGTHGRNLMHARLASRLATLALLFTGTVLAAPATTIFEPFDGTLDQASWRAATSDAIVPDAGHPGAYLRSDPLDAAVPQLVLQPALGPQFLGNYRFKGVTSAGFDIALFSAGFGADQRPVTLLLGSDM